MQQQLEAVYTESAKAKVTNPFVLLSEEAQACGVRQKYNGISFYQFSLILSLCLHPEVDTMLVIATRALRSVEINLIWKSLSIPSHIHIIA